METLMPEILETKLPGLQLLKRGKVRDVYEVPPARLLLVATDRISAFDVVLPAGIPQKGAVLTQISAFWFQKLARVVPSHLVTVKPRDMPDKVGALARGLGGRPPPPRPRQGRAPRGGRRRLPPAP